MCIGTRLTRALPDALPTNRPLKQGDWVRLKRGHYKGDLAKVERLISQEGKCVIMVRCCACRAFRLRAGRWV